MSPVPGFMGNHQGMARQQYDEQKAFLGAFNRMISLGVEAGYLEVNQNTVIIQPMRSPSS